MANRFERKREKEGEKEEELRRLFKVTPNVLED
jgi:hypothetical protein